MTSSNRPLRATVAVGQNSSSVQMAAACHVGAAVLLHVACSGRLDADLDERSLNQNVNIKLLRLRLPLLVWFNARLQTTIATLTLCLRQVGATFYHV